jgi:hypothetical protein
MLGVHPVPECGVLLSSLFEVNLLPSLGAVNGTDALYAGLKTEPRHTGQPVYLEVAATALLVPSLRSAALKNIVVAFQWSRYSSQ